MKQKKICYMNWYLSEIKISVGRPFCSQPFRVKMCLLNMSNNGLDHEADSIFIIFSGYYIFHSNGTACFAHICCDLE